MAQTNLRNDRIDSPYLHAGAPAAISQIGGLNMVLTVWRQKRQRTEALDDFAPSTRPRESLQELLKHESGSDYRFARLERVAKRDHLGSRERSVASKRQRPDAGIDEERHLRERSFL